MATITANVSNRPGTSAHARMVRMSASKARVVLNLIRGKQVGEAMEILNFSERLASEVISKCLHSAVANAEHNEDLQADDLFISACYADEGPTLKRFRPRARGRAGRIHKQTCHITIEVARLTDDELDQLRVRSELKDQGRQSRSGSKGRGSDGGDRAQRVAKSRAAASEEPVEEPAEEEVEEAIEDQVEDAVEAAEEEIETAEEVADNVTAEEENTADAADEVANATSSDEAPSADGADDREAEEGATDEVVTEGDSDDDAGAK